MAGSTTNLAEYASLRRFGYPPARTWKELRLAAADGARLEQIFQSRTSAEDKQMPRFARHDRHVSAVLAAGGFDAVPTKGAAK